MLPQVVCDEEQLLEELHAVRGVGVVLGQGEEPFQGLCLEPRLMPGMTILTQEEDLREVPP